MATEEPRGPGQELLGDHACALDDLAIDLDRVALDLGAVDDAPAAVCIRLDSDGLYELSLLSRVEVGDDATVSQADAQHEVQRMSTYRTVRVRSTQKEPRPCSLT